MLNVQMIIFRWQLGRQRTEWVQATLQSYLDRQWYEVYSLPWNVLLLFNRPTILKKKETETNFRCGAQTMSPLRTLQLSFNNRFQVLVSAMQILDFQSLIMEFLIDHQSSLLSS